MSSDVQTIIVGSDHAGLEMKLALIPLLESLGLDVLDVGTHGPESVDYPDYADALALAIEEGKSSRGILVCGSGIGISIAANRHKHIRAALCHTPTDARLSRLHNDANVLVLGARTSGLEVAADCVRLFISTDFEGGRHARRVGKLTPGYGI